MPLTGPYVDFPVWHFEPREGLRLGQDSELLVLGARRQFRTAAGFAPADRKLSTDLVFKTRSERWDAEGVFRELRGREGFFWFRSFKPLAELAAIGNASDETIDLVDSFEARGWLGRIQHAWVGVGAGFAIELGQPGVSPVPGAVRVDVFPPLPSAIPGGAILESFLFGRLASDELEIVSGASTHDDGVEVHEVSSARLVLVESQANTPTRL